MEGILGFIKKLKDQVSPFDGGKSWNNPQGRQAPQAYRRDTSASMPRVLGNVRTQNAVNDFEATPFFSRQLAKTRPRVTMKQFQPDSSSYYTPGTNRITLGSDVDFPEVTRHEGLHAIWNRKNPAAQQAYREMLNRELTPRQKQQAIKMLGAWDSRYADYEGRTGQPMTGDIGTIPSTRLNELHSEIPEFRGLSPRLQQYYSLYFNPNARNPNRRELAGKLGILDLVNKARERKR